MITQMLYGWFVHKCRPDGKRDRCPWGLVWDQVGDKDAVKPCQRERGHKGPHRAEFTENDTVVRIEWEYLGDRARQYFMEHEAREGCECGVHE